MTNWLQARALADELDRLPRNPADGEAPETVEIDERFARDISDQLRRLAELLEALTAQAGGH